MLTFKEFVTEGTSTDIFFNPNEANRLVGAMNNVVPKYSSDIVTRIVSDDKLADTIGPLAPHIDIRPFVMERLREWLLEGPGPWKFAWNLESESIIRTLVNNEKNPNF